MNALGYLATDTKYSSYFSIYLSRPWSHAAKHHQFPQEVCSHNPFTLLEYKNNDYYYRTSKTLLRSNLEVCGLAGMVSM
jgi:hypothetical protein